MMRTNRRHHGVQCRLATWATVVAVCSSGCTVFGDTAPLRSPGLTYDKAQSIVIGMSAGMVEATIGMPLRRSRFDNLKSTAWEYRYVDAWGYVTDFSVMIGDNGLVVDKVATRITPEDRFLGGRSLRH